jgi:hypothetical protein
MMTTSTRLRTLVLAFALLAAFTTLFTSVQEAGAVSGCTVTPYLSKGAADGKVTVWGSGRSSCDFGGRSQTISVKLYKNGVLIDTHNYSNQNLTVQGSTHAWYCTPGAVYKTVVIHTLEGQQSSHTTGGYYIC